MLKQGDQLMPDHDDRCEVSEIKILEDNLILHCFSEEYSKFLS